MPRRARLDVPGALHHIMVRGIDRSAIFKDDEDRSRFLERLGENIAGGHCAVYAWVLMDNHVHLLFRSGKEGISAVMRKLLTWYAQYFNRRHHRTGHLFENRYKSILCEEETYLLVLVRYIHLNPIRATIITTMDELDHYPWSGHRAIIGKEKHPWMDIDTVLSAFGDTKRRSVNEYRCFVQQGMERGRDPVLNGEGLAPSRVGWSQVLAAWRKNHPEEKDGRILGSGDFIKSVLNDTEEHQLRQLKLRRSGRTIEQIINEECVKACVSALELKQGSRRSVVSRVRATIACRSRDELGIPSAEIARHLGVATSSITRTIEKMAKRKRDNAT